MPEYKFYCKLEKDKKIRKNVIFTIFLFFFLFICILSYFAFSCIVKGKSDFYVNINYILKLNVSVNLRIHYHFDYREAGVIKIYWSFSKAMT